MPEKQNLWFYSIWTCMKYVRFNAWDGIFTVFRSIPTCISCSTQWLQTTFQHNHFKQQVIWTSTDKHTHVLSLSARVVWTKLANMHTTSDPSHPKQIRTLSKPFVSWNGTDPTQRTVSLEKPLNPKTKAWKSQIQQNGLEITRPSRLWKEAFDISSLDFPFSVRPPTSAPNTRCLFHGHQLTVLLQLGSPDLSSSVVGRAMGHYKYGCWWIEDSN